MTLDMHTVAALLGYPRPVNHDSYFDPPNDDWGECPDCRASQEDASLYGETYLCPSCGREYDNDEAHPDLREMREEHRMDEAEL